MTSSEVEALATAPLRDIAQQHLVETPPSSLLPEQLGVVLRPETAPSVVVQLDGQ